jgi:hypothetical protein
MFKTLFKSGVHKFRATKFCTVVPNICGFSIRSRLYATNLAPRTLRWLPDVWQIFATLG